MSKQQSENKIIRQQTNDQSKPIELSDQQLDAVAGGKLYEAACKGTHLPEVTIEMLPSSQHH
jgi:type VI protein secretion system component Hcp